MEPLLKSDIFFFITSIFVVVLTALLVVGGYYIIKILRNLTDASKTFKEAIRETHNDFRDLRHQVRNLNPLNFLFRKKSKRTRK